MHTAARILELWEHGVGRPAAERPLALLAAARPDRSVDALRSLPIDDVDAALLALRAALFGPRLAAVHECRACGERLELAWEQTAHGDTATPADLPTLAVGPFELTLRRPDGHDLAAIRAGSDLAEARLLLARRCVAAALRVGEPVEAAELPVLALEQVAAALDAHAPPPTIAVHCPACGDDATVPFDIGAFLWREIEAAALRTAHDVHRLARGYGWREADILAMSPGRRQLYLELLPA